MPVVLRVKGYRFWFYSADLDEPPHVHVGRDGKHAKLWIIPVAVARSGQFHPTELREMERIVTVFKDEILAIWQREVDKRDRSQG